MKNRGLFSLICVVCFLAGCNQATLENKTEKNVESPESPIATLPQTEILPAISPAPATTVFKAKKKASTAYQFTGSESPEVAGNEQPELKNVSEINNATINSQLSSEPEPEVPALVISSFQDLYKQLEKPSQTFTFSPEKDTVFTGLEGTRIKVSANSFISEQTGQPVAGPVSLQLQEYYTLADMLLANLSTKSGPEIIETGGMINLQAYAGTEKLKLREGSLIGLEFPTTNPKPGMQLFNGALENGTINWTVSAAPENSVWVANSRWVKLRLTEPKYPTGDAAMLRYINKKFPFPANRPKKKKKYYGKYEFVVLADGKIADIKVVEATDPVLDKAVVYMLATMPNWKPAKVDGYPVAEKTDVFIDFNEVKLPKTPKAIEAALETEQRSRDIQLKYAPVVNASRRMKVKKPTNKDFEDLTKVNTAAVANYALSTTNLGWINCDRFVKNKGAKLNYSIATQPQEDTDIKLVFHDYKAILSGYSQLDKFLLNGVPEKEKVTVVALKKIDSKLYLATHEMVTSKTGLPELAYQEVTLKTLQQEMKKLNELKN